MDIKTRIKDLLNRAAGLFGYGDAPDDSAPMDGGSFYYPNADYDKSSVMAGLMHLSDIPSHKGIQTELSEYYKTLFLPDSMSEDELRGLIADITDYLIEKDIFPPEGNGIPSAQERADFLMDHVIGFIHDPKQADNHIYNIQRFENLVDPPGGPNIKGPPDLKLVISNPDRDDDSPHNE